MNIGRPNELYDPHEIENVYKHFRLTGIFDYLI